MALFVMIMRKMRNNRWLELSLLFGLTISVALVSSMPMYTNAILQRMLLKDLQKLQNDKGIFPGSVEAFAFVNGEETDEQNKSRFAFADDFMMRQAGAFGLPASQFVKERSTESMTLQPADPSRVDGSVKRVGDIVAKTDLFDHVKVIDGRLPAKEPVDGVYEALVAERVLTNLKLVLGNEFIVQRDGSDQTVHIKPVGVIRASDERDVYWQHQVDVYSSSFFIDYSLFERDFTNGKKLRVVSGNWYYTLDYQKVELRSVVPYLQAYDRIDTYFKNRFNSTEVKMPALNTFDAYGDRAKKLQLLLWSLNVPVLILLGFYLFMVSNLITEKQKNEIAVLRSRGASRWQIVAAYALEGVVLGVIAFIAGPFLGVSLTKMLGASNGFLEFVQRSALNVELSRQAYQYALLAVAASLVMTLIPVLLATRVSIVGHKQQLARGQKSSFWHRFGIDAMLLAVAVYGWFSFQRRMTDLRAFGLDSADFRVDPLLFFVPALFVLAVGLLALRLYPWLVRAVYWAGRRWWPPSLYATIIQVGRSSVQYQFIMVFLILTVATGLFSASAARTINQNTEDKIHYLGGTDIKLQVQWENDAPAAGEGSPADDGAAQADPAAAAAGPKKVQYTEPPFQPFTQLPGVQNAAKVFIKDNAYVGTKSTATTTLMGIDTDDFGRVAWLRSGLLDHSFYDYLNLLASDPHGVLISRSVAEQFGVKPGDHITAGWSGVEGVQFIVFGIIDYWPGWNPNPTLSASDTAAKDAKAKPKKPNLVVGHLSYIQTNLALEPYDVWLKLKPDASAKALYDAMADKKFEITKLTNTQQDLIQSKNEPFRLAVNGVMTLGFVVSMLITFVGFLLYWLLSLSGRTLQFGILRAMGISFPQLLGMLVMEQALTSGAAVAIGAGAGKAASRLFVPMFQLSFDTATQVPPFRVMFELLDTLRLFSVVGTMIALGLLLLGILLSRIRIHQAVKLGED